MKSTSKYIVKIRDRETLEVVFSKDCATMGEARSLKNNKSRELEDLRYEVILEAHDEIIGGASNED